MVELFDVGLVTVLEACTIFCSENGLPDPISAFPLVVGLLGLEPRTDGL